MKKLDLIVVTAIIFATGAMGRNINFYSFPSGDFIPYLFEGKTFISGSLPPLLNNAPMYSVAIVLFGKLIPYRYPELIAGIIINITLFIIGTWMVWKIAEQWFGRAGLVAFFYVLLHPLSYHVTLNPLNIVAFSTAVLTTIYLRIKRRFAAAYAIAGVGYWIRPEAIALLAAMGVIDFLRKKERRKIILYVLLASLPALLWEASAAIHNATGNIYLTETLALKDEIPNRYFLNFTATHLIVSQRFLQNGWLLGALIAFLGTGAWYFFTSRNREMRVLVLYVLGYFALHVIFPGKGDRYTFPLISPIALMSLWPVKLSAKINETIRKRIGMGTRLLFILLCIGAILYNATQIEPYLSARKEYRGEYRMTANWITQQQFQRPTVVMTFMSDGVQYFTNNNNVEFFRIEDRINQCDTITCVIFNNWQYFKNKDVLVINDSFTQKSDSYYDKQQGIKLFNKMEYPQDHQYFKIIQTLQNDDRWVKIYKFINSSSDNEFDV